MDGRHTDPSRILPWTGPHTPTPKVLIENQVVETETDGWLTYCPTGRQRAWVCGIRVPVWIARLIVRL